MVGASLVRFSLARQGFFFVPHRPRRHAFPCRYGCFTRSNLVATTLANRAKALTEKNR
jgi:hypothetical protein